MHRHAVVYGADEITRWRTESPVVERSDTYEVPVGGWTRVEAIEAAGHRVKATRAESLAARLVTAQAALTGGGLADPTDLPFTEDLLDDEGLVDDAAVHAAVEGLITRQPHLAARRPTGDVGQGTRPETPEMGLAAMLRRGA